MKSRNRYIFIIMLLSLGLVITNLFYFNLNKCHQIEGSSDAGMNGVNVLLWNKLDCASFGNLEEAAEWLSHHGVHITGLKFTDTEHFSLNSRFIGLSTVLESDGEQDIYSALTLFEQMLTEAEFPYFSGNNSLPRAFRANIHLNGGEIYVGGWLEADGRIVWNMYVQDGITYHSRHACQHLMEGITPMFGYALTVETLDREPKDREYLCRWSIIDDFPTEWLEANNLVMQESLLSTFWANGELYAPNFGVFDNPMDVVNSVNDYANTNFSIGKYRIGFNLSFTQNAEEVFVVISYMHDVESEDSASNP